MFYLFIKARLILSFRESVAWSSKVHTCTHHPCRIYFGTQPSANAKSARNTPLYPCTSKYQKLPKLTCKIQSSSEFMIKNYDYRSNYVGLTSVSIFKGFLEKDQSKLGMSQWKRPETKVRCGVRNSAQNVLDSFDQLMDENFVWFNIMMAIVRVSFMRVFWNLWWIQRPLKLHLTLQNIIRISQRIFLLLFFLEFFYLNDWFWQKHQGYAYERYEQ